MSRCCTKNIRQSCIPFGMWILLLLTVTGCKKDDPDLQYPAGTNEHVNSWILDSMRVFYFWNRTLPAQPDVSQDPPDFFDEIKNVEDRFSILADPKRPLTLKPSLSTALGIDIVGLDVGGVHQALVTLVVPGAEADQAGIKRGDRVMAINGTTVSRDNIGALVSHTILAGKIALDIEGRNTTVSYNASYPEDRPIYTYKIIEHNGKKIAYLFFNSFKQRAITELQTVLTSFRNGEVTELILDLRYNAGGEVNIAALLTALIAPVKGTDVFAEYRGNSNLGTQRTTFDKALSRIGMSVAQLTAYRPSLSRVYILTGSHTGSSAELVANNLAPYIATTRIGGRTLGKDMASFEIRNSQVTSWVINPLVYKLYNANAQGDYASGLAPDIEVDEFSLLPLKPFGDTEEPLVNRAIVTIAGRALKSSSVLQQKETVRIWYDSRNIADENTAGVKVDRKDL